MTQEKTPNRVARGGGEGCDRKNNLDPSNTASDGFTQVRCRLEAERAAWIAGRRRFQVVNVTPRCRR